MFLTAIQYTKAEGRMQVKMPEDINNCSCVAKKPIRQVSAIQIKKAVLRGSLFA
jgi:hypothetical protein